MLTIKTDLGHFPYRLGDPIDRFSSRENTLWQDTKVDGDRRHFELFRSAVSQGMDY
jgi:hypothetical protein